MVYDQYRQLAIMSFLTERSIIKSGTVLAQVDPTLYTAQVAAAAAGLKAAKADKVLKAATLKQASADFERAQKLLGTGGIAQAEYDLYKSNFEVATATLDVSMANIGTAEANLKIAQTNLEYTTISAPVKGVVVDRRVSVGQTVVGSLSAPGLFLIAKDLTKMEVWAAVNEVDIGSIKNGQEVEFTVDSFPGRVHRGKVVPQGKFPFRLNATVNSNVVTYTVVVGVDNKDGVLLPYMTANVAFLVANKDNALLVPNAALRWQPAKQQIAPKQRDSYFQLHNQKRSPTDADAQQQGFLWVLGADGFVYYTQVRIGLSDGARSEILGVVDGGVPEQTPVIVGDDAPGPQPVPPDKADFKKRQAELEKWRKEANYLLVIPGAGSVGGTLTAQDADAIARDCPAVSSVASVVRARTQITVAKKNWVPLYIYGTTPSFLDVRQWRDLAEGAPFTDADVRDGARVCLIGQTIKQELFGDQSPIGQEIRIEKVPFKVVGVLSARGANLVGLDQDDIVLAPWTTIKLSSDPLGAGGVVGANKGPNIGMILVRPRSSDEHPLAVRQITDLLRQRHKIKAGQPDDFTVRDMMEWFKALKLTDR
jgi:HlyD family secretion protein